VKKGAKIITGGKINTQHKGHFFEPTILVNVNHTMKVMKEETFGPIMAIMRVHSDEEAG
jgi:acyl-CoA reductase-like NAD-dependent aldehyde dehydrogenase